VSGEGGTVGPDLTGIGGRQDRQYLLESLVMPNARMAPGFESVVLSLKDGSSLAGILKRESEDALELDVVDPDTGETHLQTLPKASVVSRERGVSAMPDGLAAQLSPFEVRDLVEYLAGLK
jgi:quinoprotein glucose dehydrogenase